MGRLRNFLPVIMALVAFSLGVFWLQYALFHDVHSAGFYLLQDLGFLPLQVLLVTLILDELMSRREKAERLRKMNMVIGVFYQEVGAPLLKVLAGFDTAESLLAPAMRAQSGWKPAEFDQAARAVAAHEPRVSLRSGNLVALKAFLLDKRPVLLTPLENANLLEHEEFTDLLWAVNHLADELYHRKSLSRLLPADRRHLEIDVQRALKPLAAQWLLYIRHLSRDYPYMYSLVVRTNPFDKHAHADLR